MGAFCLVQLMHRAAVCSVPAAVPNGELERVGSSLPHGHALGGGSVRGGHAAAPPPTLRSPGGDCARARRPGHFPPSRLALLILL